MCDWWFSWVLRSTSILRARSPSIVLLARSVSAAVSIAAHWNGVCGLGTWVDTDAVTRAARRWRYPISCTRDAVSTMPRTSTSSSVGRPIMK